MPNSNVSFSTLSQPVQNLCSPATVYGGFEQTLFLGCSILQFSANVGWDEQVTEVTVELARDPCPAPASKPKVYWDSSLDKHYTTDADPGFIGYDVPLSGRPVYFRMGEFEFSGIVQNWLENESPSGMPIYTVKLMDPRSILEGVHLITGEYAGSVGSQFNLFNCYGYLESFGMSCPLVEINGGIFGSPAGGFGGSDYNDNGLQVANLVNAFNILANAVPRVANQFSPYGRVLYNGNTGGNYGALSKDLTLFGSDFSEYLIDISELPAVPSYYRIPGPEITLLGLVSQICGDAGYSFYWELVTIKDASSLAPSGVAKIMKLRTVSRLTQPDFGAIEDFVSGVEGAMSNSVGRETVQETTAAFLVGGPVESIYQAEQNTDVPFDGTPTCDEEDDMILPYVGLHLNNNVVVPCKDTNDEWEFTVSTADINLQLIHVTLPSEVTLKEKELLALAGGYDTWLAWEGSVLTGSTPTTDIGNALFGAGKIFDFGATLDIDKMIARIEEGKIPTPHEAAAPFGDGLLAAVEDEEEIRDVQNIFQWLSTFAEKFGTQFMVRVPYTCIELDVESNTIVTSEVPQQDGWTEETTVIGLPMSNPGVELFLNENGKLESFVRFDDATFLAAGILNPGDYLVSSDLDYLWVKVQVSEKYVFHDASTYFVPRVVITLPQPIRKDVAHKQDIIGGLAEMIVTAAKKAGRLPAAATTTTVITDAPPRVLPADKNTAAKISEAMFSEAGSDALFYDFPDRITVPSAAAFGLRSNVTKYGPWTTVGLPGQIKFDVDSGLVPWEYGNTTTMNAAATLLVNEGVVNQKVAETGSVSVPGYPTIPLGAELGAVAGGFFGGGSNLVENRSYSQGSFQSVNYGFFNYGGQWTGLYGPNITSISISNGKDGITTNYDLRTYTPKQGTFAKLNADRLKKQNQLRRRSIREVRMRALDRLTTRVDRLLETSDSRNEFFDKMGMQYKRHSSATFLVSEYGSRDYPSTDLKSSTYLKNDLTASGVERRSMGGLDSIFMPIAMGVSTTWGSGMPKYFASWLAGYSDVGRNQTKSSLPNRFDTATGVGAVAWGRAINGETINPWSNPTGIGAFDAVSYFQDTSGRGSGHSHTFAGGAGLATGPSSVALRNKNSGETTYSSQSNIVALRGPVIIQQWGYDTDGKPVPNSADTPDSDGVVQVFQHQNLTDNFLPGWLSKPKTWPAAPLDIRLDRMRGVWVSPPPKSKLNVVLTNCLTAYGTMSGIITGTYAGDTSPQIYDGTGNLISTGVITIYENLGNTYSSGDRIYVDYDALVGKYYPIQASKLFTAVGSTWQSGGYSPNPSNYFISTTGTWNHLTIDYIGTGTIPTVQIKRFSSIVAGPNIMFETGANPLGDIRDRNNTGVSCEDSLALRISAWNYVDYQNVWVKDNGLTYGGINYNTAFIFGKNISVSGENSGTVGSGKIGHRTHIGAHMTFGGVTGIPTGAVSLPSYYLTDTKIAKLYVDNGALRTKYENENPDTSNGLGTGYITLPKFLSDTGTGIEVVTNVACNTGSGESGITVTYRILNFDAYGRLTSVS